MNETRKGLFKEYAKKSFDSFLWLFVLLFIIDIISKWLVEKFVDINHPVEIIPEFFYIQKTYNEGVAFGLGNNNIAFRIIFIIISWVAFFVIGSYYLKYLKKNDKIINSIFAMCLAGTLGNGIDRTFYWENTTGFSGVVDFFAFYIFGSKSSGANPFAIFNVADACLTIGIIYLLIVLIVRDVKNKKNDNG